MVSSAVVVPEAMRHKNICRALRSIHRCPCAGGPVPRFVEGEVACNCLCRRRSSLARCRLFNKVRYTSDRVEVVRGRDAVGDNDEWDDALGSWTQAYISCITAGEYNNEGVNCRFFHNVTDRF